MASLSFILMTATGSGVSPAQQPGLAVAAVTVYQPADAALAAYQGADGAVVHHQPAEAEMTAA